MHKVTMYAMNSVDSSYGQTTDLPTDIQKIPANYRMLQQLVIYIDWSMSLET